MERGGFDDHRRAPFGGRPSPDGGIPTGGQGDYRIVYGVERLDGIKSTGSFVVTVTKNAAEDDARDGGEGGGCNAGFGAALLAGLRFLRGGRGRK